MASSTPALSVIIPTRDRSAYIGHSLRSSLRSSVDEMEVIIADNASVDGTRDVIAGFEDPRIVYSRSDRRLSMRDNFERGLNLARGRYVCFIGDDDGLLPSAPGRALELFAKFDVDAVASERIHYAWPDLLSNRRNKALVPRRQGVRILESRAELRNLLDDSNYYRLPCIYHGFVSRDAIERIAHVHPRFFLSSQVDIYSAIALSAASLSYVYSESPLVINGGSGRSNGASHFGGGADKERNLWVAEDDLGFLGGFEHCLTVAALIVESALRYCAATGETITQLFDEKSLNRAIALEAALRKAAGRSPEEIAVLSAAAGVDINALSSSSRSNRAKALLNSFVRMRPIDMAARSVNDVDAVAQSLQAILDKRQTGFHNDPLDQLSAALQFVWRN